MPRDLTSEIDPGAVAPVVDSDPELDPGTDGAPDPELDSDDSGTDGADETDGTDGATTPDPEPVVEKVTPAQRRDNATTAWNGAVQDELLIPGSADPGAVASVFHELRDGAQHLDVCYGRSGMEIMSAPGAALDPETAVRAGVVATFYGAVGTALASLAPAPRGAKVTAAPDPAAVRLATVTRFANLTAARDLIGAIRDDLDRQLTAMEPEFADELCTTTDESDLITAARMPEPVTKLADRLTGAIAKLVTGTVPRGAGTPARDRTPDDAFVPGSRWQHSAGHTAEILADGTWSVTPAGGTAISTFTNAKGVVGPIKSASTAASTVNGGSSVNGKVYWKPAT